MGKVNDTKQRKTLARVDNKAWRDKVQVARKAAYKQLRHLGSVAVDGILKSRSLVPIEVYKLTEDFLNVKYIH